VHKIKIRHERVVSFPPPVFPLPLALATTWRQLGRGANTKGPLFPMGASGRGATWARSLNHTKAALPFESSSSAVWGFV